MRRPIRTSLVLACAVIASTVAVAAPRPEPSRALTSSIWLNPLPANQRLQGAALSADGSIGFVASNSTADSTLWRSIDSGRTWYELDGTPRGNWTSVAVSGDGQIVVALRAVNAPVQELVMVSINGGDTWANRTPSGSHTTNDVDITASGSHIVLATTAGVKISDDDGQTWRSSPSTYTFPVEEGAEQPDPTNLSLTHIAAGETPEELVIHTVLNGSSIYTERHGLDLDAPDPLTQSVWTPAEGYPADISSSDDGSVVLAVSNGSMDDGGNLYFSRDRGTTWTTMPEPSLTNHYTSAAVSGDGSRRVASSYNTKLVESVGSSDSGWDDVPGVSPQAWLSLAMDSTGSHLLAGTETLTLDDPAIHMQVPPPGPSVTSLMRDELQAADGHFVPETGGGRLEIYGDYFYDVISVSIGGVSVDGFVRQSPNLITLETPPAARLGRADVVVTTEYGTGTLAGAIDYYPLVAPTVTSTSITTGSFRGGATITFTGEGFREVTEVRVGGELAVPQLRQPTQLRITAPATRIGLMDISITNPLGTTVLTDGWTSTWEATREAPRWSTLDGSSSTRIDAGNPPGVSKVVSDGNGGYYIVGDFEEVDGQRGTENVAHWDGLEWSPLGQNDEGWGLLSSAAMSGPFQKRGVNSAVIDNEGQLWVGGSFTYNGNPANIARFDPVTETWWVPRDTPDAGVASIHLAGNDVIVAGDFGPLPGVPTSSRLARLSPSGTGTWTGVGSDGSSGPAIAGNGTLDGVAVKSVQAVQPLPNDSLMVGGAFRLPSTTTGHDLIAQFDGTSWQSVLQSSGDEIVTSLDRGVIDGVDTIVAGVCSQQVANRAFARGRVVSISGGAPTTVGTFDDCVRDVALVGNGIVAVGWFESLVVGETSGASMRQIALLHDGQWTDLKARKKLESVTVLDGYDLAVSSLDQGRDIGNADGAELMARLGTLRDYVTDAPPLSITQVTSARTGESLAVTVAGTGFTESTEATLAGRPADNLVVVSDTVLQLTAPVSANDRMVGVYGRSSTATATLSPPANPDSPQNLSTDATTTTTPATTPSVDLPTSTVIDTFPIVNMVPTGTPFYPGASFNVTAGGFVAGEEVWFLVASTPRRLGQGIVAANGTITANVTLPGDLVGNHTLVVWSPTTGRGVRQPITIAATAPSATVKVGRTKTVSNILKGLGIPVAKRSKFAVTVKTKKLCALTPKRAVKGLRKGSCRLVVKITPPKGKASTKRISVRIV